MKHVGHNVKAASLEAFGIGEAVKVHWNLTTPELYTEVLRRGEGTLVHLGALAVDTGKYTGRSPQDKFVVRDAFTEAEVAWGAVNQPLEPARFETLRRDMLEVTRGKDLFVRDVFVGAHPDFAAGGLAGRMDVPRGTVGCVVRDAQGRLAAGTSTGGAPLTRSGRVGDSPIPGAGLLATPAGAASATGWGEAILAVSLAALAVGAAQNQHPAEAAHEALAAMGEQVAWSDEPATGGLLLVDAAGRAGWAFSTPRMARAWWRPGSPAEIDV